MTSSEERSLVWFSKEASRSEVDFEALVKTYSPLLFRVAYSILRNRPEAEDVVQDIYIRVLAHRRSLPTVRDMRIRLVRIPWNFAFDRRRRIRPEQFDEEFVNRLFAKQVPADQGMCEA